MTAQPEELGLRERKRRATRRNIQLAVLRLTVEHGLEQLTVDDISRAAGVSARTFFNYFPSKEASIAGEAPFALTDEIVDAFADAGPDRDVLQDLLQIIADQADEDGGADTELHRLQRTVMRDHPQIFALKIDSLRQFEALVIASVARRLRTDAAKRGDQLTDDEISEKARVIGLLAMTLTRTAWVVWAEHPERESIADILFRSYACVRDIVGVPTRA
jgi:AcrR family transcriptional regulator